MLKKFWFSYGSTTNDQIKCICKLWRHKKALMWFGKENRKQKQIGIYIFEGDIHSVTQPVADESFVQEAKNVNRKTFSFNEFLRIQ